MVFVTEVEQLWQIHELAQACVHSESATVRCHLEHRLRFGKRARPGVEVLGTVRRKNILSVMAQCLGCAGLVTILWWACGYSFVFSSGSAFLGGTKFAMLHGVSALPSVGSER